MAHRARSGKPWNLIAWTKKRSLADLSIAMTRVQERTLGNTTQVKVFDERQWEKLRDAQREAIEREPAPARAPVATGRPTPRRAARVLGRTEKAPETEEKSKPKAKERKKEMTRAAKPEPELKFEPEPFPIHVGGHTLQDTTKTMAIGVGLYCFKPGTKAFPAVPLAEIDGLEIRAATNGKFIYFWAKNRLAAVSLEDIVSGARFHLTGKTEKAEKAKASKEPAPIPVSVPIPAPVAASAVVAVKRRAVCSVCKEMDIDLFTGTDLDAISKNGWVIAAGVATCPQCLAAPK